MKVCCSIQHSVLLETAEKGPILDSNVILERAAWEV